MNPHNCLNLADKNSRYEIHKPNTITINDLIEENEKNFPCSKE